LLATRLRAGARFLEIFFLEAIEITDLSRRGFPKA
jgi:hypothetical protein